MDFGTLPFAAVDWSKVPRTEHEGDPGVAQWRTVEAGALRLRRVDYSPGYSANHWCRRGHVLFVIQGELTTELEDGRTFTLKAGMSYHVANDAEAHRSRTEGGASLFIVD